ncbi:MAG: ATP-dependent DNA helicase RecQ [Anaerolineae bacterium]|nr:ATP-dependent DNA helicase RecQ [Anaerolineae bacterium]
MDSTDLVNDIFQAHFSGISKGAKVRDEQRKVIETVLAYKNTLALMPTGSGKSLCYWIAGKALGGITLAIFPLTALMDEQESKLVQHGCKVLKLHGGIDTQKQYRQLIELYNSPDKPDFIFVSPERLATDGFVEFVLRQIKDHIKLVVIDEAHCISQWGINFRPFYKEIPFFLDNVFVASSRPLVLCLTATLNPKEREDICRDFQIAPENVIRSELLLRYKIHLRVVPVDNEKQKDKLFWRELENNKNEKILVYIENRNTGERSTEGLCEKALERGFAAAYFHADMSVGEKSRVIEEFKAGKIMVVFATSAFGMGIDIPDIRGVIHYRLPESTEQYYQQVGRVGRDNKPAWALLYYSEKNISIRKSHFIEKSFPSADDIRQAFRELTLYKKGKLTANYFADSGVQAGYHYLIRSQIIEMVCKAIRKLDIFELAGSSSILEFERYQQASKTGLLIFTARKLNIPEAEIMENMYRWLAEQQIKTDRAPEKCLVIEAQNDTLPEDMVEQILADAAKKKAYLNNNLDEFVNILKDYKNSQYLHQAIGEYLGVDKFQLNRIHDTTAGIKVRSKSEVIIVNLMHQKGIPFSYEINLQVPGQAKTMLPDFTIDWNGKRYYWEHWGMYSDQGYRQDMYEKKELYAQYFPDQLIETYDSHTLTADAEKLIDQHFT